MEKRHFNVYQVCTYDNGEGGMSTRRTFVGDTWAVSESKARVNVEYRLRGKALYGGMAVNDMGHECSETIYYEAEEVV
jgi:hypothetical protein